MMIEKITPAECEEITSHFRDQLIYYENIKPWKLYIRKMIWTHLQEAVMITNLKEQADRFLDREDIQKALKRYFATTFQKATPEEITAEMRNCESNYRVIEDYTKVMCVDDIPTTDMKWVPDEDTNIEYISTYKNLVPAKEFVEYWYANVDTEKKVPLFHLYRKRYYDWVGNNALHKTLMATGYAP